MVDRERNLSSLVSLFFSSFARYGVAWLIGVDFASRFALVPQPGEHGEAPVPAGVEAVALEVADPSAAASSSSTRISGGPRAGHPPGAFPSSGSGSSSEEERMDTDVVMGLPVPEDLD